MSGRCRIMLVGCLVLFLGVGCGPRSATEEEGDSGSGIERVVERGPVSVTLRLDKESPTIADRIVLELEVTSEEEYRVIWPGLGENLDQFGIVDYTLEEPELLGDGRTRRVRSYVLEPFLSGTYLIPEMEFGFEAEGEENHQLITEELSVEVRSLLAEQKEKLNIHDIAPPVDLARSPGGRWWLWLLAVALLVGGAGAALWWRRRRGKRVVVPPPRPAHEIAFAELEELVAQDWPGKGDIKRFYQEISSILRRYLENRFGVHAPGQTTEEFLVNQSRSGLLEGRHLGLLQDFLQHCDLVKFAELDPSRDQVQDTFDTCKAFILETRASEPLNLEEEEAA